MRKLYYRFKLAKLLKEHTKLGRIIDRINHTVYPVGDVSRIKDQALHYDLYVRTTEQLYSVMVEEANLMLHLGEYDCYKAQCSYIKQFEPLIWTVKTA